VFGAEQDFDEVLVGEVGTEHQETGEVELAGSDRVQQGREATDEAGGGDAAAGFVLRKAELIDAVRVQAGAGASAVDAACFDLTEVCEQGGHELVRTADKRASGGEQLDVGELGQR
jgi:hypothetical protein